MTKDIGLSRRTAEITRKTTETEISGKLVLEGSGQCNINTPLGFLNHMLEAFVKYGNFDLSLKASGDIDVDQHHLVEDSGLVIGFLFRQALEDRAGISRSGFFIQQMDDAVVAVTADISGRPFLIFNCELKRRFIGDFDSDLLVEFFRAMTVSGAFNLSIQIMEGNNDHHVVEAIFKGLGRTLNDACRKIGSSELLSTKGLLLEAL